MKISARVVCSVSLAIATLSGCNCSKTKSPDIVSNQGELTAQPATLDFGNVPLTQSGTLQLSLTNTGSATVTISTGGQSLVGDTTGSFSAQAFSLAFPPGWTASGLVTFAPTVAGPLSATLEFDNDGAITPVKVQLQGVGIDVNVSCAPASVNFGSVQVGAQPAPTQNVVCTNGGTTSAAVSFSTAATDPQFTVSDANGPVSASDQHTLAPGQTYSVAVAFEPAAAGNVSSTFAYVPCDGSGTCAPAVPVALNGVGITGSLTIVPHPISFVGVPTGNSAQQVVTVTNVGSNGLTVTCLSLDSLSFGNPTACGQASPLFAFVGLPTLPATLGPGDGFSFTLGYTASGGTTDGDQLDAFYTSVGSSTVYETEDPITGNQSVGPCELSIAPPTINFGTVTLGSTLPRSATLTNNGGSDCHLSGVALDPTSDPSYALDPAQAASFTIPAGGSAAITVDFDLNNSNTPNQRRGLVNYVSDDPNHATGNIPLIAYLQGVSPYANGWPKWHRDNNNSGYTSADTSANAGTVMWKFSLGDGGATGNGQNLGLGTYLNSPVVGDDGDGGYTVYQLAMNGTLYALAQNGKKLWGTYLSPVGGDPHPGTPIVTKTNTLYAVTSCDYGHSADNLFYLSVSGQILSSQAYGEDGFDATPSLAPDGTFFEADDDGSTTARAGNPNNNGADPYSVMSFQAGRTGLVSLTSGLSLPLTAESERFGIAVGDDGSSYWANNGQFFAVTPPPLAQLSTWPAAGVTQSVPGVHNLLSDLAIDPVLTNAVFAYSAWASLSSAAGGVAGILQSLDLATGAVNWTVNLPSTVVPSLGGGSSDFGNAAPAYDLSSNQVYVGAADGLRAINMTNGTVNWTFATADVTGSPSIGGDGTVFFGCKDGSFYAVSSSGTLRYKVVAAAAIRSSPAIADDGTVFFVSDDGTLWAVK